QVSALSSARARFTFLFGMGRCGSRLLWSSDYDGVTKCQVYCVYVLGAVMASAALVHGYRIKPHGQLVSVSSTHYCAYTPDLSTLWSSTTLQGGRAPGEVSS